MTLIRHTSDVEARRRVFSAAPLRRAVGFGVAVFLAAFRYIFSTVSKAIAIAGMVGGIAIVTVALLWTPPSPLAKESLP